MTHLAAWLTLTFVLGAAATFAVWGRCDNQHRGHAVLAFLVAAVVSFFALQVPLGSPTAKQPAPGKYEVLGARIDLPSGSDKGAIYVLLDSGEGEPVYYRLPFSTSQANSLQDAMTKADGEGGVGLAVGESGENVFHPPAVAADEPKAAEERPMMGVM